MLGKFPRYTFHVGMLPGKDVFILTEELDERAFYLGGLGGIAYHKFHRLGLDGGLECWGGVRDLLLRHRHLRGIDLALDLLEFFVVEDSFRVGCFSNLAVPSFGKASGYGDDTVCSGYLEFVVDEAWFGHEHVEYVAAEYDVVHALEGDHLKGHALLVVIINVVKGYLKCNAPKGPSLPTRNYAVEDGVGPP